MKKVLITGATSSQYSMDAHKRNARFAGLLNSALSFQGVHTELKSLPIDSVEKDISEYSSVVVGLAPVTSLSANKFYTSISALSHAIKDNKHKIFFDAPDPVLVFQSYKSVLKNPNILTKSLYSTREGYQKIVDDSSYRNSVLETLEYLLEGNYDIIYPSLPYYSPTREMYGIPSGIGSFTGLNFDSLFADRFNVSIKEKSKYWLAESPSTKWGKGISLTLSKPVIPVKRSAYDTEADYISRMQNSFGYLNGTYKNDTLWWSPNTMLALSCGVPVFSDWRHTGQLGVDWSGLPHSVEDITYEERCSLAMSQKVKYLDALPDWQEASELAVKTIITKKN